MIIGAVVVLSVLGASVAWLMANATFRQQQAEAERAWGEIAARAPTERVLYDPSMVTDLPEIAKRYFTHAIAPGTALTTVVALEMDGQFLLGDSDSLQTFEMAARQILNAPSEFVWSVDMRSGPVVVSGSDGLYNSRAWMRMSMFWAIPLVEVSATEGLDRSALARPALEAVWAPAALLPMNGAVWTQIGPDKAKVTVGRGDRQVDIFLTIAESGRVVDVVANRWSDANPEKVFQDQPFGGTMEEEATFGGFTVPSVVHVGNHYGTDDYFAFFKARIVHADYL